MFMLFYLDLLQNDAIVTSQCKHFIFCRGRDLNLTDVSALPVTKQHKDTTRCNSKIYPLPQYEFKVIL